MPPEFVVSMVLLTVISMIAAYGPYAASATGGNGVARDFLAGIAAIYSTPCRYKSLREHRTYVLALYICKDTKLTCPSL